jgi:Fe-S-cluster containining protein
MSASSEALCQACGACCAYSAAWPRFGLETEAEIAAIPRDYVDDARGTMRCVDDRCAALAGVVGVATACTLHAVRPQVCRACEPGDDSCVIARQRYGLSPVTLAAFAAP